MGKVRDGYIYIKGVTVRFGFDVLEPGKFKRFVKNKATGTPCGVYIQRIPNNSYIRMCYGKLFGCSSYIYHRGAFGVARFDRQGNAKTLTREASDRLAPRFFCICTFLHLINPLTKAAGGTRIMYLWK